MSDISLYHYIGLLDFRNLLWSVRRSYKSNHILWLPHWKRLYLVWVIFLANLGPPLRQSDIFLTGKKTFEYSFESFSSRERIGNIIWYEIIDYNCKGGKQILQIMPERCFCEGPIKCINWTSTTDFQLNQNVSSWSPRKRVTQRFSASECQRQNRLLSNSTFDVRHHYLSKSWRLFNLAFRIWPNLALRMATLSNLRIFPLETLIALEP